MTKEDIIYAAGFIDGEGCITTSTGRTFRITIANTNKDVLDWLQSIFGGHVNNQHLPKNTKHNIAWKWVICAGDKLVLFLDLVAPYLRIKKREAMLVRDYLFNINGRSNRFYTEEQKQEYQRIKDELRKLKIDKHWNRD